MIASRHLTFPLFLLTFASLSIPGCTRTPAVNPIPENAALVSKQKGRLFFVAPSRGTVYIADAKASQLIFTTTINRNDKLVFYPEQDRILLNGFAVKETTLDENRVYRLYFLKG